MGLNHDHWKQRSLVFCLHICHSIKHVFSIKSVYLYVIPLIQGQSKVPSHKWIILRVILKGNKAENNDFQSYAAGRGYITILGNAEKF